MSLIDKGLEFVGRKVQEWSQDVEARISQTRNAEQSLLDRGKMVKGLTIESRVASKLDSLVSNLEGGRRDVRIESNRKKAGSLIHVARSVAYDTFGAINAIYSDGEGRETTRIAHYDEQTAIAACYLEWDFKQSVVDTVRGSSGPSWPQRTLTLEVKNQSGVQQFILKGRREIVLPAQSAAEAKEFLHSKDGQRLAETLTQEQYSEYEKLWRRGEIRPPPTSNK